MIFSLCCNRLGDEEQPGKVIRELLQLPGADQMLGPDVAFYGHRPTRSHYI